ncbi:MAG: Uma2 family endonuclease, partial [Chloroflexota bacterium]|nr:Uma2 family endonuclease [Chloroflexota bacterium]
MAQQATLAPPSTATDFDPTMLVLQLRPVFDLTDDQLAEIASLNGDLRLEWTAEGALEIMAPAHSRTGNRNIKLATRVTIWAEQDGTGETFDASAGFRLPNGAVRSPDVSWVRRERLVTLTGAQRDTFLPLCPDFVLELRSDSDKLTTLQAKMREYLANGARLGWLIDPQTRTVHIYR